MTQFLPPNLLALFAPRDPIPFLPPADKLPHEKKTVGYAGVGIYLSNFEDPKNTPPPTRIETREERQERKRREKAEQVAYKLEQDIALWDPQNSPVSTTDPYKTLFIARINYDTSEQKLRREFEVYGSIRKIVLVHDKDNGRGRGYAFIEYEHERDMHSAYKHADGKKIDGRRVLVDVERGRIVKGWLPRRLGGGLGGTRRGGPEVNVKHSGREDSRLDERYLGPCRDRDGGRGERERERNAERPERAERDRGERPERGERDRDREREKRRSRSRSRDRKRRASRSRSPREVREVREPRESRERHRERRKHREPRESRENDRNHESRENDRNHESRENDRNHESRETDRNHDRSTEKSDSMDGINNVPTDAETPKRDRERKRSRSRERDRERKRRRSRSRSRERSKRRDRDHRGDRDDRREKDRGDKDERSQRDEDRILREDEIKQEVTQDGYSTNDTAYDAGDNFAFESKPIPYENYNEGEEYTPYEAENYNNE